MNQFIVVNSAGQTRVVFAERAVRDGDCVMLVVTESGIPKVVSILFHPSEVTLVVGDNKVDTGSLH